MRPLRYLAVSLALAAGLLALATTRGSAAPACTITWDGSAGTTSWHTVTNWDLNRVPVATDHVCIPAAASVTFSTGTTSILSLQDLGTLTLTGGTLNLTSTDASNATTFNQSGGILGGPGTLNISVGGNWTGGSMVGAGTTNIAASATLVQDGYTYLETGRLLNNAGLIELHSDKYLSTSGTPVPVLHNTGTIRKTGGAGTFTLYPELDNDGSIVSNAGTLSLYHNPVATSVSTGDFGAPAAPGKVQFDGGAYAVGNGARFLGGVVIDGGTVNVAAGSTLAIAGTNGFTSGILGGAGTANISGTFTWTGGSMVGAGTTNIAASATLVQDGYTYLETGRLLNNAGLIELHSDKYLSTSGTPVPVLH